MASLGLLLLAAALVHAAQSAPAARGGGRGPDVSMGGARRQRRDLLPYDDRLASYPATQGGGGAGGPYYRSDGWRGRGLDQALQRLVERDQRRELEEERQAAYLSALLRLLDQAQSAGLVGPGDMEAMEEEEEEEEDQGPEEDFQPPPDYDETGRGLSMQRPPAAWWGLLEPQLAQALLDRMEPQLAQTLLDRSRFQQAGRRPSRNQENLRRLVARILSSMDSDAPAVSSGQRARRDLTGAPAEPAGPAHRRARRSLDSMAPPSPSNNPPLVRVKRLEEEEEEEEEQKLRTTAGLQRMKRIDAEELHHGTRRRRAILTFDPQILIDQIVEYMRE